MRISVSILWKMVINARMQKIQQLNLLACPDSSSDHTATIQIKCLMLYFTF